MKSRSILIPSSSAFVRRLGATPRRPGRCARWNANIEACALCARLASRFRGFRRQYGYYLCHEHGWGSRDHWRMGLSACRDRIRVSMSSVECQKTGHCSSCQVQSRTLNLRLPLFDSDWLAACIPAPFTLHPEKLHGTHTGSCLRAYQHVCLEAITVQLARTTGSIDNLLFPRRELP